MHSPRTYYYLLAVVLFAVLFFSLAHTLPPGEQPANDLDKKTETVRLNIVIPGSDTTSTAQGRHRIAGNTESDARAYINDEEVRVFPSGGFAGLVDVPVGQSTSRIRVISADGESRTKNLYFIRPEEVKTTPAIPLVIEQDMMKPEQLLELGKDEVIEIQFRGSAGQRAYFRIDGVTKDIPMQEQPLTKTGGIGGIYVGRYTTREDDFAHEARITYTLRDDRRGNITVTNSTPVSITPDAFPRVAEVNGRRAHLNAGIGTDRLGGPRLGFLESGVRVEVIGRVGVQYRVRLSDNLEGYLPARFVKLLPEQTPLPRSATGSITVNGNDDYDMVTLTLAQRLPYVTAMSTRPNTIEVDIYGADSNTNWIAHQKNAKGIKSVDWNQVGPNHFQLQIHLEHDIHWGYQVRYGVGSSLQVQVQRPPTIVSRNRPLEDISIAIDVGHGGNNLGALGSTGVKEKDVVFDIARKVRDRLEEEGVRVLMTRDRDIYVSLVERSEMIIASDAHVLVSIHANSIGTDVNPLAIHGTSTYYRHEAFRPLANIIHNHMLELPLRDFGLFGGFNFTLNALTELPNVLVETGFISHPEEEMKLLDPEFQDNVGEIIVKGLREYFLRYGRVIDYSS